MDNKKPPTIKIVKQPVNTIKYVQEHDSEQNSEASLTSTADHRLDTVIQPAFSSGPTLSDAEAPSIHNAPKSMSQTLKKAKSVNIRDLIKHDAEAYRQQVQYYSDIFQSISGNKWTPASVINQIHILVKSLELDAVSIMLIDPKNPSALTEPVSRGFRNPPGTEIASVFAQALNQQASSIDWRMLMDIAADEGGTVGHWIKNENICMTGFSPITDGHVILGFLFVANYSENEPSQLASPILELCGSGLGVTLLLEPQNDEVPVRIMNSSSSLQNDFTELINYIENLKKNGVQLSEEELNGLAEKSKHLMDVTLSTIRHINETAQNKVNL